MSSFLRGDLWGYTSSSMKSLSLVKKAGLWREELKIGEDYDFLFRCLVASTAIGTMQKKLLKIHRLPTSLGAKKNTDDGLADRLKSESEIIKMINSMNSEFLSSDLESYVYRLLRVALNSKLRGHEQFGSDLADLAYTVRSVHYSHRIHALRCVLRSPALVGRIAYYARKSYVWLRKR